jgi:hypothetical protein
MKRVVVDDVLLRSGANRDAAEVGVADAAVHFAACQDRHFMFIDEANSSAEIGDDILAETETEREDIVAFDEERALLGEEQRKPREVRSTRVDLGFGEICVHGRGREDI